MEKDNNKGGMMSVIAALGSLVLQSPDQPQCLMNRSTVLWIAVMKYSYS